MMTGPRHPAYRTMLLAMGIGLVLLTPIVVVLPGPAGIFTFAGGAGLILRNSLRARRHFVRAKRRFPRTGNLADRALRRASVRRRRERQASR